MRFRREAKALATLSHPNILTLFAFGSEGEMAYAVSELLEGEALAERMWHQGAGAWRAVLDIGLSVVDGLAAAHDKGITHRDMFSGDFISLKPLSDLEFAKYEGQFDYA